MPTPQDVKEAIEIAQRDADAYIDALTEIQAPDGVSAGEDQLTDAEFVPFYVDLWHTPSETPFSVMDYLPTVSPDLYKTLTTRFTRIVSKNGSI